MEGYPLEPIPVDVANASRGGGGYPRLACAAQRLPAARESVIFVPHPFHTGVPKAEYMAVLQHIQLPPAARAAGDRFIKEALGGRPFVGVHLRGFEGMCQGASR